MYKHPFTLNELFAKLPKELSEEERLKPNASQLVVVMGLQGSGKTSVARYLNSKLQGQHFDADTIRNELYAGAPEFLQYSDEAKTKIDDLMDRRAIKQAFDGTAIIDSTFWSKSRRDGLKHLIEEAWVNKGRIFKVLYIFVHTDDAIAEERIKAQRASAGNLRIATVEYRQVNAQRFYPLDMDHVVIVNNFTGEKAQTDLQALIDQIITV